MPVETLRSSGAPRDPLGSALDPDGTDALIAGDHGDPFAILGRHETSFEGMCVVRAFLPGADAVEVIPSSGAQPIPLGLVRSDGFFAALVPEDTLGPRYRLAARYDGRRVELEDPYRFLLVLGEMDVYLLAEGSHRHAYEVLGAHRASYDGVEGTCFAVWAPNARRVSVVGDFNGWDGRHHPMRLRPECGCWEIFLPGIGADQLYKYEIKTGAGDILFKADPFARSAERPPATASRTLSPSAYVWKDDEWMERRARASRRREPVSIYEVHLGSWRRRDDGTWLSYCELAGQLVSYVADLGFTHIELLPITEHPFNGSWGYQPSGMFAPTARFGAPDDFRSFIDACHQAGIGVILDWVPGHFPGDAHGLGRFDGTCLYEHEDERLGRHKDWDTLIYNYGRNEVANYLITSAIYWLREFHIDGLRIDAVASMLYLDYSRAADEWMPNVYGDNRNLEAIRFLRELNTAIYGEMPDTMSIAEESTAWPMVSQPVHAGGLGFGFKWNMGWMHDTLRYMGHDPVHRRYHHNDLTFGMLYAYSENFVLPLSHDEVVHGKGSLLGKMPGDRWQQFANVRLFLAYMYAYPGKKLLFMGSEFAQPGEWNHDGQLDWGALADAPHQGIQSLTRDLNRLYRDVPALHDLDCEPDGFHWIDCENADENVIAFLRRSPEGSHAVVVCNFSSVVRGRYRIGIPETGIYREVLNTDAQEYGGSGAGNLGAVASEPVPCHGLPHSLSLTLPPLAVLVLVPPSTAEPQPRHG
jgi:1,4-alpha-glucan branching enzyme